jgi:hypothetical protein
MRSTIFRYPVRNRALPRAADAESSVGKFAVPFAGHSERLGCGLGADRAVSPVVGDDPAAAALARRA